MRKIQVSSQLLGNQRTSSTAPTQVFNPWSGLQFLDIEEQECMYGMYVQECMYGKVPLWEETRV